MATEDITVETLAPDAVGVHAIEMGKALEEKYGRVRVEIAVTVVAAPSMLNITLHRDDNRTLKKMLQDEGLFRPKHERA